MPSSQQHEYGDCAYPIDSQFTSGRSGLLTVDGPTVGWNSALLSAGVAVQWNERVSTCVYYYGQVGHDNYDNHKSAVDCASVSEKRSASWLGDTT